MPEQRELDPTDPAAIPSATESPKQTPPEGRTTPEMQRKVTLEAQSLAQEQEEQRVDEQAAQIQRAEDNAEDQATLEEERDEETAPASEPVDAAVKIADEERRAEAEKKNAEALTKANAEALAKANAGLDELREKASAADEQAKALSEKANTAIATARGARGEATMAEEAAKQAEKAVTNVEEEIAKNQRAIKEYPQDKTLEDKDTELRAKLTAAKQDAQAKKAAAADKDSKAKALEESAATAGLASDQAAAAASTAKRAVSDGEATVAELLSKQPSAPKPSPGDTGETAPKGKGGSLAEQHTQEDMAAFTANRDRFTGTVGAAKGASGVVAAIQKYVRNEPLTAPTPKPQPASTPIPTPSLGKAPTPKPTGSKPPIADDPSAAAQVARDANVDTSLGRGRVDNDEEQKAVTAPGVSAGQQPEDGTRPELPASAVVSEARQQAGTELKQPDHDPDATGSAQITPTTPTPSRKPGGA